MGVKRPRADSVKAGDTFLVVHASYNHLYVVCSDPATNSDQVLIISITTLRPKEEECCIITAGEHPFVKHRSCARYKDAKIVSVDALLKLLDGSLAERRQPVSADVLARIRAGASQSDYLPEECRRLLQGQSLI